MNFPVVEMFASIQGEGKYVGQPSIFVRVSGCNLRCCFKDSICDTPYTSYDPEKSPYKTMDDVINAYNELKAKYPNANHIVITGGEPLLYKDGIREFLNNVYVEYETVVTIETNGTLPPLDAVPIEDEYAIDLYSISPKLSTSVGNANGRLTTDQVINHNTKRINIPNLCAYVDTALEYQFKFVYSGPECIDEIKDIYRQMDEYVNEHYEDWKREDYHDRHPNKYTMLMPEGITNEQLAKSRIECAEKCLENGWCYTDRTHIIIWGDKRGV